MAQTLEIFDGSVTIDLLGSNYTALFRGGVAGLGDPPSAVSASANTITAKTLQPRTVTIPLKISGSSVADLRTKIRDLDETLREASDRRISGHGTVIVLKTNFTTTSADDTDWRILEGGLVQPQSILNTIAVDTNNLIVGAVLRLLVEPLGRLAQVSPTDDTLENEVDSTNLNYDDFDSLTGNQPALANIKLHDTNNGGGTPWNGSKTVWIAKRSGSRKTDTLFIDESNDQIEGTNPFDDTAVFSKPAGLTTNASGGTSETIRWTGSGGSASIEAKADMGYFEYDIAGGSLPKGLFRVLVRASMELLDTSAPANMVRTEFGVALGWKFGSATLTPAEADYKAFVSSTEDEWEIIDVGEISIPPHAVPEGITAPTLTIRIHAVVAADGAGSGSVPSGDYVEVAADHIFLLPIDEGAVIVNSVGTNDRIFLDGQGDNPGVYLLNTSDVAQQFATSDGKPFPIGPEDTRIMWLRDDIGDPTTIQAEISVDYLPQVGGV